MSLLSRIYGISFLFAANLAITAYVNSTFLAQYIPDHYLGIIYAIEALLTLVILELIPLTETSLGNRRMTLILLLVNICSLGVLASGTNAILVVVAFVLYFITNNLIVFALDIFVRHFSNGKKAGTARGFYLMVTNVAWVAAPFITGYLVTNFGYGAIYFLVCILVTYVFMVISYGLDGFRDTAYKHVSFLKTIREIRHDKNIMRIMAAYFMLQFFFSWMVIYTPIYLHEYMHFGWESIGIIFTIMLLPFVLLQYPLGKIADKYLGEKRLLVLGLIILIGATGTISFMGIQTISIWAIVLFATRVGAATMEVMCEAYFFKKIDDSQPSLISSFRAMIPLAFLVGPLMGSLFLFFVPFSSLFLVLAIIMTIAFCFIIPLKDIR